MNTCSIDKNQMEEYRQTRKTLEQYYRLKILLDTVRRPDSKEAMAKSRRHREQSRPFTKRHKIW